MIKSGAESMKDMMAKMETLPKEEMTALVRAGFGKALRDALT